MTVLFPVPVTLVTRAVTGQDGDGNDVRAETTVVTAGVFAPGGSVERADGGDQVVTQPTVSLPTGSVLDAVDAILVNGVRYQVDGDPARWPANPFTGWTPDYSVEVRLRKVTG